MCEIIVLDPEQAPIEIAQQIAGTFHEEQGDGLGVLAVKNHGDHFTYETYKSTDPHWQTLYSFFRRIYDEAWRVVIHGRAATAGEVNRENSHPIEMDCQHCDVEYVVHNGSVRKHQSVRSGLVSQGHSFETKVDSEIIGHKVGQIPDDLSEHSRSTYSMSGNLNYLAFSRDGILARVTQKYHMTDEFTLTCSLSNFDDYEERGFERDNSMEWLVAKPAGAEPEIETKERTVYTANRSTNISLSQDSSASSTSRSASTGAQESAMRRWNDEYAPQGGNATASSSGAGTYSEEYVDHSTFDHLTAIRVAPGVMKIIDDERDEEEYIWRDREPRLYYYYSPDPTPENLGQLEEFAARQREESEAPGEQETLDYFPEKEVGVAVAEEVSSTIAREVDGVDVSDLSELRDDLVDDVEVATQSAIAQYGD